MQKPPDYDTVQAPGEGFEQLPPGGYICVIKGAEEGKSRNGRDMLIVSVDIVEGEFKDYFLNQYRDRKSRATGDYMPKWGAIYYVMEYDNEGHTNSQLKGFVESVKQSNPGFEPSWDDKFGPSFKDRYVGMLFRREAYISQNNGKQYWSVRPSRPMSVERISKGDFKIPEDRIPDDVKAQMARMQNGYESQAQKPVGVPEGFAEIDEDDLPF